MEEKGGREAGDISLKPELHLGSLCSPLLHLHLMNALRNKSANEMSAEIANFD